MKGWVVYLLSCADGTYYCGVTNDLEKRLRAHNGGLASKYTRSRLPVRLKAVSGPMGRGAALSNECRIKGLPRKEKPAAVRKIGRPRKAAHSS